MRRFGRFTPVMLAALMLSAPASAQRPAAWRLTPDLRIGPDEQGERGEFTRIVAVLPLANGSVMIADGTAKEIRLFSATGEYIRSAGRSGRGPGEFSYLRELGLLGDTVWAIDAIERRVSYFSADGTPLSTARIESRAAALTALLPAGRALGMAWAAPRTAPTTPLVLTTRGAAVTDTLVWLNTAHANVFMTVSESRFIIGQQRFSDAPLAVVAPGGQIIFVVDRTVATDARSTAFRVLALEADGDTLWNRALPYMPKPLEKARGDSLLNSYRQTRTGSELSADVLRRGIFIPDFLPPVTSAVPASDGSLWLRREEAPANVEYWVLDKTGSHSATVTVPATLTLMAATATHVWGVQKDEFDVPTVVRYRITR